MLVEVHQKKATILASDRPRFILTQVRMQDFSPVWLQFRSIHHIHYGVHIVLVSPENSILMVILLNSNNF